MSAGKYYEKVSELLEEIRNNQADNIEKAAKLFAERVRNDQIIHMVGSGHSHMIAEELFVRAGGLANVNSWLDLSLIPTAGARKTGKLERLEGLAEILWEEQKVDQDDLLVIISNSGRNSVPVETAMLARDKGIYTIGITSLDHSQTTESRHPSGKKLYQLVDLVIDTCVPHGDGLLDFRGVQSGPGSTLAGVFIANSILSETLSLLNQNGDELPVYGSQNVDGVSNEDLYQRFEDRITYL
ncbi:MAG: sugar isomerase domain-containing protein [Bacillota bacterium]